MGIPQATWFALHAVDFLLLRLGFAWRSGPCRRFEVDDVMEDLLHYHLSMQCYSSRYFIHFSSNSQSLEIALLLRCP